MFDERVLVAMAADRSYLFPWAVAFASIVRYSDKPVDLWFGLAQDWKTRLSKQDVGRVLSLASLMGSAPRAVEVAIDTRGLPKHSYISPTAFVKLGLLDLCPKERQMVWFDADLVIRSEWNSILHVSKGKPISGNPEIHPSFESRWSPSHRDWYANTGVLVADGDAWRSQFAGTWQKYLGEYSYHRFQYLDQDVLNATTREVWNHIPATYNFRPIHCDTWNDPAVVHFSGRYKPWMRTRIQERLLKGVWAEAFAAYAEAEGYFWRLIDVFPRTDRDYWLHVYRSMRGLGSWRAWLKYTQVLAQGALRLN